MREDSEKFDGKAGGLPVDVNLLVRSSVLDVDANLIGEFLGGLGEER